MVITEAIKKWIKKSITVQDIQEHRAECEKRAAHKFCLSCRGGGIDSVMFSLRQEISEEITQKGNTPKRTDIFMTLVRAEAGWALPANMREKPTQELIDYIKKEVVDDPEGTEDIS